jgi:phosphoribosylformimino-5-aminoimidazole carboxamide ribotide isomerase
MLVIPAVDIMNGKCVRLVKGDQKKGKVYFDDPLEAAKLFEKYGAELIHLIDLDAALGSGQNLDTVKRILKNIDAKVQIGGGIRTLEKAATLLELGAFRVIFGTAAVKNPKLIKEAIDRYGQTRIAVAIDEKDGKATFHGWKAKSEINYIAFASMLEEIKVGAIIFTSTDVDGTLKGPQMEKTKNLVEAVSIPVIASGGISSLQDLIMLAHIGVEGTIVGTALYEGRFTIKQAMEAVKNAS